MPPKKKTKTEPKKEETEDEEETSDDDEEDESTDDEDRGRGKRKKRSSLAMAYEPEDFTEAQFFLRIIKGRGKKLGAIPSVKESIDKYTMNSEEMLAAHRLLFNMRAGVPKREMKHNILSFSGYLKEIPKGYDKEKMKEEDEAEETKYSKKAYKLNVAMLRKLCDFFNVDRSSDDSKQLDKDALINRLLDFLCENDQEYLNDPNQKPPAKKKETPKKKKSTPKKTTPAKKKAKSESPVPPLSLVKDHKKGSKPSDAALRQWVQAYVACFDMDSATTKHAIKTASDKFGLDLTASKPRIKELLAEEM